MPRKRAGKDYGPNSFRSLTAAYSGYQKDRLSDKTNPTIAPRDKFAQIWGWNKKAKP